ncbi:uncharacterized protein DSM5745_04777 [Aspergillus mulundensis]|uniref:Uncharacterized protein n=1 Tax=Aspergillus mulundensis TaxID=1810919 RepID=A0A3D8S4U1_9EURO|nr:Uncharacterized protein DSM5745_04777 [Aspergillus mulundensis]RDW81220.1 Uncharacterized protein DSM5745_04777 [Aspergillus mulundensis]
MISSGYCWLRQPSSRVVYRLPLALPGLRHASSAIIPDRPGPPQSQLLRFALTGGAGPAYAAGERQLVNVFLEDWPLNSTPAPLWTPRTVKTKGGPSRSTPTYALANARNLRKVRHFIEKNVISNSGKTHAFLNSSAALAKALKNCERGSSSHAEILAFINGLEERLKLIGSPNLRVVHVMGMRYACAAFSEPALRHHLKQHYLSTGNKYLRLSESVDLVRNLLSTLEALSFQDPKHNTDNLRRLVTGSRGPSLNKILWWTRKDVIPMEVGEYLSLLVRLKIDRLEKQIWERYLKGLTRNTVPSYPEARSAYVYAMSLVDAGKSSKAVDILKQASLAWRTLPGISNFERTRDLLKDDAISSVLGHLVTEGEFVRLLHNQLGEIEQKLGITWLGELHPDESLHIGLSNSRVATGQPVLDMDGDSPGYESAERLVAEIRARGCSKSPAELGKIADLLDEYEGNLIPISIETWPNYDTKLYWAPERSPLELGRASSASDISQDPLLSNLGLARVIACEKQSAFVKLVQTLHLIQLGYLLTEKLSSSADGSDASPQLEHSGYMVAWDRVHGRLLVVYAGTSRGKVDPSTGFSAYTKPAFMRSIMVVHPIQDTWALGPTICIRGYRLELDPCPDLILNKDREAGQTRKGPEAGVQPATVST